MALRVYADLVPFKHKLRFHLIFNPFFRTGLASLKQDQVHDENELSISMESLNPAFLGSA